MATYRDAGIVLRTRDLGEADRIVTLLTRERGKVRAVAKGVRRAKSRFGARLEPFMHADLQLYEGRSLDTVTQAVTLAAYGAPITTDYPRFTAASAVVEAADKLSPVEHHPARSLYRLTLGALAALARGQRPSGSILDSYLLRALAISGYAPALGQCAVCGRAGPHRAFAASAGGMVCQDCRPPGAAAPAPGTVALLGALLAGAWDDVAAADARAADEAAGLVAAFTQYHMERAIRALRLVERDPPEPAAK
ncbi:MAG: DNA repair protein RecO [Bifidobacteriaceae bacterium]|jgi:DNA repair protein RecO (recombination protein O)|nr:DNA repair protein RecO [Bifidobacteriaceae bacterium]